MRKDGARVVVIRPENPEQAILDSKALVGSKDAKAFNELLKKQRYTFQGYAAHNAKLIVNEQGEFLQTVKPGDSFVNERAIILSHPPTKKEETL